MTMRIVGNRNWQEFAASPQEALERGALKGRIKLQYIQRDPVICGGEPVVTGTRVTIHTILASLAEGMSVEKIIADFPLPGNPRCL